jgi:hypothetical protein
MNKPGRSDEERRKWFIAIAAVTILGFAVATKSPLVGIIVAPIVSLIAMTILRPEDFRRRDERTNALDPSKRGADVDEMGSGRPPDSNRRARARRLLGVGMGSTGATGCSPAAMGH